MKQILLSTARTIVPVTLFTGFHEYPMTPFAATIPIDRSLDGSYLHWGNAPCAIDGHLKSRAQQIAQAVGPNALPLVPTKCLSHSGCLH